MAKDLMKISLSPHFNPGLYQYQYDCIYVLVRYRWEKHRSGRVTILRLWSSQLPLHLDEGRAEPSGRVAPDARVAARRPEPLSILVTRRVLAVAQVGPRMLDVPLDWLPPPLLVEAAVHVILSVPRHAGRCDVTTPLGLLLEMIRSS